MKKLEKFIVLVSLATLMLVTGSIVYMEASVREVTVIVDIQDQENPFQAVRQIIPKDSTITYVKEVNRASNEYQITINTRRQKDGLLRILRDNPLVERLRGD